MIAKILLLLLIVAAVGYGKRQTITVKGRISCDKKTVSQVRVQLREADTLDPDDTLSTVHSDSRGFFEVSGEEDEVGSIEPYLTVFHHCLNGVINSDCDIEDHYYIPKEYINGIYDMGILNLNIATEDRSKNCRG